MKQIDTKGKLCPAPLILAKKGLQEAQPGETVEILTDNDTACSNLLSYLSELGLTSEIKEEGAVRILRVVKPESLSAGPDTASYCAVPAGNYAVVIKSETMGDGDDELGRILLRAFINSLKDADKLPASIVLYNAGIHLALEGTDTAATLRELEDKGVTILACGTCMDFYGVKHRLSVGIISNMYKITKVLSEAGHVIYP